MIFSFLQVHYEMVRYYFSQNYVCMCHMDTREVVVIGNKNYSLTSSWATCSPESTNHLLVVFRDGLVYFFTRHSSLGRLPCILSFGMKTCWNSVIVNTLKN